MDYVGKWKFNSIGITDENGETAYLSADEYLDAPMPYIDANDADAVASEMRERKMAIESMLSFGADGTVNMLMKIPEEISPEELDAAVKAGEIRIIDGMMSDRPLKWEMRGDELWVNFGFGEEDGFAKVSDGDFVNVFTVRYEKVI